jgi:diguanylate cyclase (GGDEF)-like protein
MIEGFDVRTLALTNLLLGIVLGLGLLSFARVHPTFNGVKQAGISFLILAMGFLLVGLRGYINDWFSVILANSLVLLSFSLLGHALFLYFKEPSRTFIGLCISFQLTLIPIFSYLTFIDEDIRWRIITMSFFIGIQFIYIAQNLKIDKEAASYFLNVIRYTLLISAGIFIFRMFWTLSEGHIGNYMDAGIVHGLSLIVIQFMIIIIAYSLSWSASDRLAKSLAHQATIDPLTQIYNRRALQDFAQKALSQAKRIESNIVVIIMDIDDFKEVNDKYGHQAGDQVLIEFSKRLKDNLREYDTLARFGGEEFILLLPNTELDIAKNVAEKLRKAIAAPVFLLNDEIKLTITASFGVAMGKGDLLDWHQLLSQADTALYQAKKEGKNKVNLHFGDVIQLETINL